MALNKKADGSNSYYSSIVNVEVRQGNDFSAKYIGSKNLAPVIKNEGDALKIYAGKSPEIIARWFLTSTVSAAAPTGRAAWSLRFLAITSSAALKMTG